MNKAQKDAITKNNQIFRQRLSALGAKNTQLKTNLEAAQKESATILEERDAFKASAPTESSSVPHTEELERLRREKVALEQALQKEKSKPPVQASIPDASDLEVLLVRISLATQKVTCLTLLVRPLLHKSEINFSRKRRYGKSPQMPPEAKAVQENREAEKAELVKP